MILPDIVEIDPTFELITMEDIINGCFELEFGYYDLSIISSYTDVKFTKAWKITSQKMRSPLTGRSSLYAYINDANTEVIYHDNGLRF